MTPMKNTCRRLAVGSLVGSIAMMGSVVGIAHADNPAPPGPIPNPPSLDNPPSTPIPLPGGGG
jgi:hypothetical protein